MITSCSPPTIRTATQIFRMRWKNSWNSMAYQRKARRRFSGTIAQGCTGWANDQRILDFRFGFWIEGRKRMKEVFSDRVSDSCSDNLKSKIENPKWVGRLAILLLLTGLVRMADAQEAGKVFRIGFLDSSTASGMAVLIDAFRQELGKLGWNEGKNFAMEYRFAEQKQEGLPELAADLVRLKVDLIVVTGAPSASAAKSATATIPIVMTSVADPVGGGLVASLARPGGNVTGFTAQSVELNTKRLEILKDAVPKLARIGLLWLGNPQSSQLKELRSAALALKLRLEEIETQLDPKGLEVAFQTAKQKQVQWGL